MSTAVATTSAASASPLVAADGPIPEAAFRQTYLVDHSDIDDSGVVHFSRYAALFENALLRGLHARGAGLDTLRADGLDLVVAQARVDYVSPARFPDCIDVAAWAENVGAVRLCIAAAATRVEAESGTAAESRTLARGRLVFGVVDAATGRPTAVPARFREALSATIALPEKAADHA